MATQYQFNNGSFGTHFLVLFFLGGISFFWLYEIVMGNITVDSDPVFASIAVLFFFVIFFYPLFLIGNVSDKIPAIKEYNEKAKENGKKKIKISHPKTTLVLVLYIAGLFTFGILWIFALIVATGTHNITITDDIAMELGIKEAGKDGTKTNAEALVSLKKLLDEGVLTEEQFNEEKERLGF